MDSSTPVFIDKSNFYPSKSPEDCEICCLLSIMSVAFIFIIAILISTMIICPMSSPRKSRVDSISFPLFNFSSSSNSPTSENLATVLINVPIRGLSICYYQSRLASLSYKNVALASSSNFRCFDRSRHDAGVQIKVSFAIDYNYLNTTNREIVNSLASDFRTNYAAEIGVNIRGMSLKYYHLPSVTWLQYQIMKVSCKGLKVGFQPNTTTSTSTANLLGGPNECDSLLYLYP